MFIVDTSTCIGISTSLRHRRSNLPLSRQDPFIRSLALVALSPHKHVASNADSILQNYAANYRDTIERPVPNHQKSRHLAIKTLLELSVSNLGKKGPKLVSQVPAAKLIIKSSGNARMLFNPNEFQNIRSCSSPTKAVRVVKSPEYYLECNQVVVVPSGERNFHNFYYLKAGTSPEERQHLSLHLANKTQYRYLTVFHFGNIEFTVDRGRDVNAAVVCNIDALGIIAEFFGVQPSALESTLAYKMKLVKKELCLNPDGASDNCDDLSKTLYTPFFVWLNEHINQRLCHDDFDTFIGLFDLPGPQNMTSQQNSLNHFCINFAKEHLQGSI
ncbi:P-loop containing nucleoside triphosphate hydrolase protein [Boletus coccyginus]|nr:P-loop containing nucleoside triphosphate hydrolase protein [Boletus coccyginus]